MGRHLGHTLSGIDYARDGAVATLTFNRPEKRNALGPAAMSELERIFIGLTASAGAPEILVVKGTGDFFCAGVDTLWIGKESAKPDGLPLLVQRNASVLQRFERLPQLVVVHLNGPAIGYGAHLALGADFALAVENSYIRFPEARLGFPDVVHLASLTERLGRSRALRLLLLDEKLDARDAATAGVIHECSADARTLGIAVDALVNRLLSISWAVRRELKKSCAALTDSTQMIRQVEAVRRALR